MPPSVTLDGHSLSIADVVAVARGVAPVTIAPQALASVAASRRAVETAVGRGDTIYGVNTGFGKLAHVRIKPDQARDLQLNLIRSHASGVGEPLPVDAVLATLLVHDGWVLWRTAHAAAAMSLEAVRGTPAPFDPRIHEARPHAYQQQSATLLRALLADSEIRESHRENDPRVQDAYSLRCTPQVLGAVGEGLAFAERLVATELNAATDNPLVIDGEILSGGNFHGQPIALALDVIGI